KILPMEPVVAIVNQIHGSLPLAVASGGHKAIVVKTLDALGLTQKFDVIIGAEDYLHGKPAPDPFLEAARRLGVLAKKCLVFEDTQIGVQSAKAAGMQWVLVPPKPRI